MYEIEVFECNSGVGKESKRAYNIVLAKIDERVGKIFSDVELPKGKVKVNITLSPNKEMFLSPRITAIVA